MQPEYAVRNDKACQQLERETVRIALRRLPPLIMLLTDQVLLIADYGSHHRSADYVSHHAQSS